VRWDLSQLMQALQQVKAAKNRFVERKYLAILNEPLVSSGTLSYVAPDRIEKNTEQPKRESLRVEQGTLTMENDQGQRRSLVLQDYPEIWAFVESIRGTLAGDLTGLTRFYDVSLDGTPEAWQLFLQPKDAKVREMVSSIRIVGKGNMLRSVETRETDGDRTVMTVLPDAS
jgi:outer membrane lipoprotein-sorting protein